MGLTIRMRMFTDGARFFTSEAMFGLESEGSLSSTTKENLLLYYCRFSAFVVAVIS